MEAPIVFVGVARGNERAKLGRNARNRLFQRSWVGNSILEDEALRFWWMVERDE